MENKNIFNCLSKQQSHSADVTQLITHHINIQQNSESTNNPEEKMEKGGNIGMSNERESYFLTLNNFLQLDKDHQEKLVLDELKHSKIHTFLDTSSAPLYKLAIATNQAISIYASYNKEMPIPIREEDIKVCFHPEKRMIKRKVNRGRNQRIHSLSKLRNVLIDYSLDY